jgi:hypothetical protein
MRFHRCRSNARTARRFVTAALCNVVAENHKHKIVAHAWKDDCSKPPFHACATILLIQQSYRPEDVVAAAMQASHRRSHRSALSLRA